MLNIDKYYPRINILQELKSLSPFAWTSAATFIFSTQVNHEPTSNFLLILSIFIIPLLLLTILLTSTLKLNYYQLTDNGVRITTYGIFHREMLWAHVQRIISANIMDKNALGIIFKPDFRSSEIGKKVSRKYTGFEHILLDSYSKTGSSLFDDIVKKEAFKKQFEETGKVDK